MVNEGFLDFFKKTQPQQVESPPVVPKPSEPKVVTPKKNAYAEQFVKIFDKLNEMATKNGFKESERYIEQESGLDSFNNYVEFKKGSRVTRFDYYWDKNLTVGNLSIEVSDSGVDEYKTPKEVSQKEIPTVAKELFSTKTKIDTTTSSTQKVESFETYLNRTIDFENLKDFGSKKGWKSNLIDDNTFNFEKGDDKIIVTIPVTSNLSKKLVSNIEYKGEKYDVLIDKTKQFLATILLGKEVPTNLVLTEPNVSFITPSGQTEPTPDKVNRPRVKTKSEPVEPKIEPKEYYNKLFDFDLIQSTAINKGWKVEIESNKETNKYDSILFTRGGEDIIVIPHEDKGNVSIETKKGVSNVEFKYVKKVLIELLRTVEKKPVPNKEKEVVPKISPKDKYNKLFDFDLVQATAVNKGWKVDVTQNVDGDYETITFIRGDDVIKVFPHENNASIETDKGATDVDYKYVKKTLLELIKSITKPIKKVETEPKKTKLTQSDYEKLFRYNEIKRIAQQAGWKQTIQFAPKSDTLNKSYAKFVKDKNEILFKPHDESGNSVLMVNGKLNFVPYKDVYKKITTLLNK